MTRTLSGGDSGSYTQYEDVNGLVLDRSKLSPEILKLVDAFDTDHDGDIDVNELLEALRAQHALQTKNKMMKWIILVGVVLFALMTAATFAVSFAAAELAKEVKTADSGGGAQTSTLTTTSGTIVATASVTPAIAASGTPLTTAQSRALQREWHARNAPEGVDARSIPEDTAYHLSVVCQDAALPATAGYVFEGLGLAPYAGAVEAMVQASGAWRAVNIAADNATELGEVRVVGSRVVPVDETGLAAPLNVIDYETRGASLGRFCCSAGVCLGGDLFRVSEDAGDGEAEDDDVVSPYYNGSDAAIFSNVNTRGASTRWSWFFTPPAAQSGIRYTSLTQCMDTPATCCTRSGFRWIRSSCRAPKYTQDLVRSHMSPTSIYNTYDSFICPNANVWQTGRSSARVGINRDIVTYVKGARAAASVARYMRNWRPSCRNGYIGLDRTQYGVRARFRLHDSLATRPYIQIRGAVALCKCRTGPAWDRARRYPMSFTYSPDSVPLALNNDVKVRLGIVTTAPPTTTPPATTAPTTTTTTTTQPVTTASAVDTDTVAVNTFTTSPWAAIRRAHNKNKSC